MHACWVRDGGDEDSPPGTYPGYPMNDKVCTDAQTHERARKPEPWVSGFVCAHVDVGADGGDRLYCWGSNDQGELGRGYATTFPWPEARPVKAPASP